MNATEKIIAYFEENEDIFNSCIEELDSFNGYLKDNRYYEMELLDEFLTAPTRLKFCAGLITDGTMTPGPPTAAATEFTGNLILTVIIFTTTVTAIWCRLIIKTIPHSLMNTPSKQ